MLIYANHLNFEGVGAEEAIFRGIGVWLKEQLGFGLHPVQLREDGEHRGRHEKLGSWLRIYATDEEPPQMYSWVLKVNDNTVRGRQWITELGLKIQNGKYYLSCVLKTEEHSAMVDDPVIPSQPRVVRYIVSNVESEKQARFVFESVGTSVKNIGPDLDSYRALLIDIERRERPYPIVLVSPDHDGRYRVNPLHLQKMLLGLAQVVQIDKEFDSYEMAEVLGNHWSAWDGAVNLVSVPAPNGFIRGHIFRADEIDSWGENQYSRVSILLKWVTHNTNVPQSRHRVRVEGVMQLALRRKIQLVRARTSIMNEEQLRNELDSVWQLADEQAEQVAQLEQNVLQLEEDNETLQFSKMEIEERLGDEIRGKDYEISSLKIQLGGNYKQQQYTDVTPLIDLLVKPGQPSPEECLNLIETYFANSCIVLPSAKDSACKVQNFRHGQKLLSLLKTLVTKYIDQLKQGGDNLAKHVFGKNEFAANESETVMANPDMRRKRIFEYNGEKVEMFRHLRIGVEDDTTKTIRVHFHWDAAIEKVIIGYCGEHLPVSGH